MEVQILLLKWKYGSCREIETLTLITVLLTLI